MPQKVLKFTGINRQVNEFQSNGACEELINLRSVNGGLRVIKPKKELETSTNYMRVYEHSFGETSNIIAVNTSRQLVFVNAEDEPTVLCNMTWGDVEVSTAGNVLVAINLEKNIQKVFRFVDGKYEEYGFDVKPLVDLHVSFDEQHVTSVTVNAEAKTQPAYEQAMLNAASRLVSENPNGLCGAAVIGLTYEFEDGSEDWSTGFIVADVSSYGKVPAPVLDEMYNDELPVTVYGLSEVNLEYKFDSKTAGNAKRVHVYTSRQLLPYKASKNGSSFVAKKISLEDLGLDGEQMYYVDSIDIDKHGIVEGSIPLKFNAEQVAEKLMPVTSGCIRRTGHTYSYNNRFFYYGGEVKHAVQIPCVQQPPFELVGSIEKHKWLAYVKLGKDAKDWTMVNYICELTEGLRTNFTYPMAGVKEMAFVKVNEDADGNITVPYDTVFYVEMKDSSAYNYSYAFDVVPYVQALKEADDLYFIAVSGGQRWGNEFTKEVFWKKDDNAINVSAPYNPYIFPVNYSYSFGGEVLDITTMYMPISSTQIGQYPVTVFTSSGIYTMEQGSGSTLFGNVLPIQPMRISGKSASTPYGIFFIAANNLYMLIGREATCVSDVLAGSLEKGIRETPEFQLLCCTQTREDYMKYNLSAKDFEEEVGSASLAYDPLQNELYINIDMESYLKYAYVLNLKTMSYHKTSRRHYTFQNGARYALADGDYALSLVDLHAEEKKSRPVLLQSRPFALEALFTHIQRMILLADAKLKGSDRLCFSVFASDNLSDWKCIISSCRANTVLRQIRTNKAAKSYRDYVILINGLVGSDTDLSDIIADYTVVSRRLG